MILVYKQNGNHIVVKQNNTVPLDEGFIYFLPHCVDMKWYKEGRLGDIHIKINNAKPIDIDLYHKFRNGKFHITKSGKFRAHSIESLWTGRGGIIPVYGVISNTGEHWFKPKYTKHKKNKRFSQCLTWGKQ